MTRAAAFIVRYRVRKLGKSRPTYRRPLGSDLRGWDTWVFVGAFTDRPKAEEVHLQWAKENPTWDVGLFHRGNRLA
jgi:hypothetical protein